MPIAALKQNLANYSTPVTKPYLLRTMLAMVITLPITMSSTAATEEPLQEVVVTATRIAKPLNQTVSSIAIVSGEKAQLAQPQISLDEALGQLAGVFLQNRYNFAQDLRISIRGFGARANFGIRGIQIFVDGMPETLADGQGSVDAIDLSSIQRIEVLKGPSAALYGNASGGIISIESELGAETPVVEMRYAFGEYDFARVQSKIKGSTKNFDYLISASDHSIDGYRNHSESKNTTVNLKARYQFTPNTRVTTAFARTYQPLANDPGGITRDLALSMPTAARDRNVLLDAGESLDQSRIGWILESIHQQHYYSLQQTLSEREFNGRIPTNDGVIHFLRKAHGARFQYRYNNDDAHIPFRLMFGIDHDAQKDDRQRFQNLNGQSGELLLEQEERVRSLGYYTGIDFQLNPDTSLSAGLRYDEVKYRVADKFLDNGDASGERTLREFSPSIGVAHSLGPRSGLFANISTSFESPTTTELAIATGGLNPLIEPQRANSYEAGWRFRTPSPQAEVSGQLELAVFQIDLEDELIPFEQMDGSELFVNAGSSRRRGLELSWQSPLSRYLSAGFSYTYSDFEFIDFTDSGGQAFKNNDTPGIPEQFASLELRFNHPLGMFASLTTNFTGDFALNNQNSERSDSYMLSNLRMGAEKRFGAIQLSPFVGINNLTDADYSANHRINAFGGRYFEPGPTRHAYGGLTFRYWFD